MENSTAALLRVIGMLRRQDLAIAGMDLAVDDHSPAFRLTLRLESERPVDLLYRQLEKYVCVYEVRALTENEAETDTKNHT